MQQENRVYIAIDLKSFYASVECRERRLDPLTTNLVVADESRTEKTICLSVSPAMKAYGVPGRPRLFEVVQKVREANARRRTAAPGRALTGSSWDSNELNRFPERSISYITAPPRMALYMEYSTRIYNIYLKYIAPEDIHVYSIDEVFMDVTAYLGTYRLTARELAAKMMQDVLQATGITATAGIGSNLYLCKVAMDIVAKHIEPDQNGARIAELDEMTYRRLLWNHRPLTDFWRVGKGYARKLEEHGIFTMGDVARCSVGKPNDYHNEELLYRLFGVNAELLIDHAWGWEPCAMADIKAYKPAANSIGSGQVLQCPYDSGKAKLIVREMTDLLVLNLVDKGLVTDRYGRKIPKHAHGTANLDRKTSSTMLILDAVMDLYDRIIDHNLLVRRIYVTACHVTEESAASEQPAFEQLDLFTDYQALEQKKQEEEAKLNREKQLQQAMLGIQKKYGKNAVLKGMNLEEGATARERNRQIGGHKA